MWIVLLTSIFCAILIPIFERIAPAWGVVDSPTDRKQHIGDIPLVGGIAIFCSISLAALVSGANSETLLLLTIGGLLVALGVVDDLKTLSARFRLLVQVSLVSVMFYFGDMRIEEIGRIFGGAPVEFTGVWSWIFTVVCAVGVINAINMIDGLDGLAGSILLVSFAALGVLSVGTNYSVLLFSLVGCLVAFLAYNNRVFRSNARVFMGDSGSMFLGLALVWFFVKTTQGDNSVLSSVSAGWIFGLPLMETISVMVSRLLEKRSPFDAGRDHMHHRLRRAGFSVNWSVAVMLSLHIFLAAIGVYFATISANAEAYLFWAFVGLILMHFGISRYLLEPMGAKAAKSIGELTDQIKKRRHGAY